MLLSEFVTRVHNKMSHHHRRKRGYDDDEGNGYRYLCFLYSSYLNRLILVSMYDVVTNDRLNKMTNCLNHLN